MNNWDYPLGSDTPDAPWNQEDPKEIERDVVAAYTISTCVPTTTTDYYVEGDCDEGYHEITKNTNWEKEFREQHYTPIELIEMYKKELEKKKKFLSNLYDIHEIDRIIKECELWEIEEEEIYELK